MHAAGYPHPPAGQVSVLAHREFDANRLDHYGSVAKQRLILPAERFPSFFLSLHLSLSLSRSTFILIHLSIYLFLSARPGTRLSLAKLKLFFSSYDLLRFRSEYRQSLRSIIIYRRLKKDIFMHQVTYVNYNFPHMYLFIYLYLYM